MAEETAPTTRYETEVLAEDTRFAIRRVDEQIDETRSRFAAHEARFASVMGILAAAWRGGRSRQVMRRIDGAQRVVWQGYSDRISRLMGSRDELSYRYRTLSARLDEWSPAKGGGRTEG